jgi:hypothetical protein
MPFLPGGGFQGESIGNGDLIPPRGGSGTAPPKLTKNDLLRILKQVETRTLVAPDKDSIYSTLKAETPADDGWIRLGAGHVLGDGRVIINVIRIDPRA